MALKKCKECGNEVSSKAKECPSCGAPVKRGSIGCLGAIFIVIAFAVIANMCDSGTPNKTTKTKTKTSVPKVETRQDKVEKYFSAWDGSHMGLTRYIKNNMNDPKSYEHVETSYWDNGDHLVVKTTFRGKNAFGGVVVNWVKAKVDLNNNVIGVIAQGP